MVANARISAKHVATNVASETRSNAEGYFRLPLLQVETYSVSVTAPGFKELTETGIQLEVAKSFRLDAQLQVGAVSNRLVRSQLAKAAALLRDLTYTAWLESAKPMAPRGAGANPVSRSNPQYNPETGTAAPGAPGKAGRP